MHRTTRECRICGNSQLESVLDLGSLALTGVFPRSRQEVVPRMPLELVRCAGDPAEACGLVQLRHSAPPELLYGGDYGYRSSLNRSMVVHLHALVKRLLGMVELGPGDIVLDIGSNDGTLLNAYAETPALRVGMDPTAERFRAFYDPGVEILPCLFSAEKFRDAMGGRKARIITSIAMFYDLEAPQRFLDEIREILHDDGVWMFEQSYLPEMMAQGSFDTVCHEHLEYYALRQIQWMAVRSGLSIVDVAFGDVNGGSFAVTVAKEGSALAARAIDLAPLLQKERELGLETEEPYRRFRSGIARTCEDLRHFLDTERSEGRLVLGYGASTKGNVLLQHCDISGRDLPCIADVNPDKYGAFTPGTCIPIVAEAEARAMSPDTFLVFPWHFRPGILKREQAFLAAGGRFAFPLPVFESIGME